MVKVAIAGGTGALGRTIVEVLHNHPHHEAVILSCKQPAPSSNPTNVPVVIVDYTSPAALTATLECENIHTIISALGYHGDSLRVAQNNLVRAAIAASTTRRFAPSAYAVRYPRSACAKLPTLDDYFGAIDELRAARAAGMLQWTVFLNGIFLDYFCGGELKSYLKPNCFAVDVENCVAAISGTGEQKVSFTWTFDVARFIVAALDLDEWTDEESCVCGDALTWKEFVALAEEVRGTKFRVEYDDIEKLERGEITELPAHVASYQFFPKQAFQSFMAVFERFATDESISYVPPTLNAKFPEIKPLTVRAMLEQCWGKK